MRHAILILGLTAIGCGHAAALPVVVSSPAASLQASAAVIQTVIPPHLTGNWLVSAGDPIGNLFISPGAPGWQISADSFGDSLSFQWGNCSGIMQIIGDDSSGTIEPTRITGQDCIGLESIMTYSHAVGTLTVTEKNGQQHRFTN